MKSYINLKKLGLSLICVASIGYLSAQNSNTTYFTSGFDHRHNLNPAFMPERGIIDIPVLSNLNVGLNGNFGLNNFLYNYDDPTGKYSLTTFLHRSIDGQKFINDLPDNLKGNVKIDMPILGFGFYSWGGYNTFGIGFHTNVGLKANKSLFDFLKNGQTEDGVSTYDMSNTRVDAMSYMDISFGHSREINERLTVGAKVKLLFGLAQQKMHYDKLIVEASEDRWIIDAQGESITTLGGLDAGNNIGDELDFDKFEVDAPGIAGFGMGIDLGGSYKLTDDITLSAAILNLGWINWSKSVIGKTENDPYIFDGFQDMGSDNDINDQMDQLGDDLEDLFKFRNAGIKNSTTSLSPTLNIGGEYKLPAYRKLSLGLLSSTTFRSKYTYTELRGIATVSPTSWFDASLSGAFSNYGAGWGAMINFHPRAINFFIATDFMPGEVNPQFIPVKNFNMNINFGLSFAFVSN